MTKTRVAVDLVLPTERSKISQYQWVEAGNRWLAQVSQQVRVLVIIGISYMDVDRDELDSIFGQLNKNTSTVVIDPYPNEDLLNKLRELYGSEPLQNIDLSRLPGHASGPNRRERRHQPRT